MIRTIVLVSAPLWSNALASGGSGSAAGAALEPRPAELSPAELRLWNSPDFRRRFTESYLAETEIEPRVTQDEREKLEDVLELIGEEQLDRAVEVLEDLSGPAASAVIDFTLANVRFTRGELEEAAGSYATAVHKHPKFRRAWKNLGFVLARQDDFERAVNAFTRVIELGGGDALTYGLLGTGLSKTGDDVAAESAFRMAALLEPDSLDWKMGLARSFFQQGRFAEAAALCKVLIEGAPGRADLWLLQANAYLGQERRLEAAQNLELVDGLGGSTPESLALLGDVYVNEELFDLAVDAYGRCLAADAKLGSTRALRGALALVGQGALDETQELVAALRALPEETLDADRHKRLLKLEVRLAVARGAGDEEAAALEEIVRLDPLDAEALILLGRHHQRMGRPEEAVFRFERAANIEGFEAEAKKRHGQLLVSERRYAEALPLLRRALELQPSESLGKYVEEIERLAKR